MLSLQLQTLPDSPGVYQFFDSSDTIIYVGKAKNLKKRVSSYFNKEHDSPKTRVLVSKIVRIEHIVVATENDALLLENNLIKKYQPRYNILLKMGKAIHGFVFLMSVFLGYSLLERYIRTEVLTLDLIPISR